MLGSATDIVFFDLHCFCTDSHTNIYVSLTLGLPLFALFRFKSCVSIISGVDGPLLLQQIAMNIPDKGAAKEE